MPVEIIDDSDALHRRLNHMAVQQNGLVTSAAFITNRKPDNEISVDLARLTTPEETLRTRPNFGIGRIFAGAARSIGFEAVHDPIDGNPAHSLIRGENTKAKCRLLAEQTVVIILPR